MVFQRRETAQNSAGTEVDSANPASSVPSRSSPVPEHGPSSKEKATSSVPSNPAPEHDASNKENAIPSKRGKVAKDTSYFRASKTSTTARYGPHNNWYICSLTRHYRNLFGIDCLKEKGKILCVELDKLWGSLEPEKKVVR